MLSESVYSVTVQHSYRLSGSFIHLSEKNHHTELLLLFLQNPNTVCAWWWCSLTHPATNPFRFTELNLDNILIAILLVRLYFVGAGTFNTFFSAYSHVGFGVPQDLRLLLFRTHQTRISTSFTHFTSLHFTTISILIYLNDGSHSFSVDMSTDISTAFISF